MAPHQKSGIAVSFATGSPVRTVSLLGHYSLRGRLPVTGSATEVPAGHGNSHHE